MRSRCISSTCIVTTELNCGYWDNNTSQRPDLTIDELRPFFGMNQKKAAAALGIGVVRVREICHAADMTWPVGISILAP